MFDYGTSKPMSLYSQARKKGRRGQRWSFLKRDRRLLPLADVASSCRIRDRWHAGTQTVAISQIRGSESRCEDFDRDFHPLSDHNKGRWLGVASARHQGKALPAIDLVQVDDVYFVRDGHHRVSVARAVGQLDIEANVTAWQVSGPRPWDARVKASVSQERRGHGILGAMVPQAGVLGQ
jgi:hypothetical protein